MIERIEAYRERVWIRFGCPGCGGWLGVRGEVRAGAAAERIARRIDAFTHRHASCRGRAA